MSGLVDGILTQLGPSGLSQIAKGLGADESDVGAAMAAALPTIIAGMANNAEKPAGAESLANALDDHSPSIFDPGGLGSVLNEERQRDEAQGPSLGGLASMLDADGDGSIVDDILGKLTGQ